MPSDFFDEDGNNITVEFYIVVRNFHGVMISLVVNISFNYFCCN